MTTNANRLLEEALQLAPNERAKIAAELLSSLDEQDDDVKSRVGRRNRAACS